MTSSAVAKGTRCCKYTVLLSAKFVAVSKDSFFIGKYLKQFWLRRYLIAVPWASAEVLRVLLTKLEVTDYLMYVSGSLL